MIKLCIKHLFASMFRESLAEAHNRIKSTYGPAKALAAFKRRSQASKDGKARIDRYKHIETQDMTERLRLGL